LNLLCHDVFLLSENRLVAGLAAPARNIVALALTLENFVEILTELTHTPKDNLEKVNCEKLVNIASIVHILLLKLVQFQRENT